MKAVLGNDDETYLYWSNIIASNALGMCILFANETNNYDEALDIIYLIEPLDMEPEQKVYFEKNSNILHNNRVMYDTNRSSEPAFRIESTQERQKSGCFIATMVYGYYDAPEVIVLRNYRDDTLQKYPFGRFCVRLYYKYSPKLAEKIGRFKVVKKTIRYLLDIIVKVLAK